ncbi:WbqC family protein, partial [Rheinheimera baltica]
MKCAIMQPTFLPWSGYFNLMASVDVFVFLDDAQFQKGSWHNRNRIPLNGKPHWL